MFVSDSLKINFDVLVISVSVFHKQFCYKNDLYAENEKLLFFGQAILTSFWKKKCFIQERKNYKILFYNCKQTQNNIIFSKIDYSKLFTSRWFRKNK